jgi:hypothetical protein
MLKVFEVDVLEVLQGFTLYSTIGRLETLEVLQRFSLYSTIGRLETSRRTKINTTE